MTLQCFDQAVVKKLQNVFPNVVSSQEERLSSDGIDSNAELRIPLIYVWRTSNALALGVYSSDPMVRRGLWHPNDDDDYGKYLRSLPVTITYQIDIISDKRSEVDDIFRELAYFLYKKDSLSVEFDLGDNEEPLVREFTIKLLDNSPGTDYGSFSDRGRLYRETLNIEISNASLLFISSRKKVLNIPVRIYTVENGEKSTVENGDIDVKSDKHFTADD